MIIIAGQKYKMYSVNFVKCLFQPIVNYERRLPGGFYSIGSKKRQKKSLLRVLNNKQMVYLAVLFK